MNKSGFVYVLASRRNGTIYIGVTSDLPKRVYEHRHGLIQGFTRKYGCKLLVWYQAFDDLHEARHRELQMKEWRRAWKLRVIEEIIRTGRTFTTPSSSSPAKAGAQYMDWIPAFAGKQVSDREARPAAAA